MNCGRKCVHSRTFLNVKTEPNKYWSLRSVLCISMICFVNCWVTLTILFKLHASDTLLCLNILHLLCVPSQFISFQQNTLVRRCIYTVLSYVTFTPTCFSSNSAISRFTKCQLQKVLDLCTEFKCCVRLCFDVIMSVWCVFYVKM